MKKRKFQIVSIICIIFLAVFFGTMSKTEAKTETETKGNNKIEVRDDCHAIPSVTKYLNNKYGTKHSTSYRYNHVNIDYYYKTGNTFSHIPTISCHVVQYKCPKCKKVGVLIYEVNNETNKSKIIDMHKCNDKSQDTREEAVQQAVEKIRSLFKNYVSTYGTYIDLVLFAALWLLIVAAIISLLLVAPVFVLA